jgi:DNA polymerase elongation subunit (family B)
MQFYTNVAQDGKYILVSGRNADGSQVLLREQFRPHLFMPRASSEPLEPFQSILGKPLKRVDFDSISEAKGFIERYSYVDDFLFGQNRWNYQWITENYPDETVKYDFGLIRIASLDIEVFSKNGFPSPEEASEPVTAITVYDSKTAAYYVWGLEDDQRSYKVHRNDIKIIYEGHRDEIKLLNAFLRWWAANYPDILTGWHSSGFDVTYLVNRIRRIMSEAKANLLSPWGKIRSRQFNIKGKLQTAYELVGISDLDYMNLFKKFYLKGVESYKLEFVASLIIHKGKKKFKGSLHTLYETDFQSYIEYNIRDVELIVLLEKALRYIELCVELTYIGHVAAYSDAIGSVKYWEMLIYNYLYAKGIVPNCKIHDAEQKSKKFDGAYVKDPQLGMFRYVVCFDLTSLYPSLIRQINIGPETLMTDFEAIEGLGQFLSTVSVDALIHQRIDTSFLKEHNLSLSGNATVYRRDVKSFLSTLCGNIFDQRVVYKNKMKEENKAAEALKKTLDTLTEELKDKLKTHEAMGAIYKVRQESFKVLINSCYGAVGNAFFQYFDVRNAKAVTLTGQVIIQYIEKKINEWLNKLLKTSDVDYVIASDTDSLYLNLERLVNQNFPEIKDFNGVDDKTRNKVLDFLDKVSKSMIAPYMNKCFAEMFDYLNNVESLMDMKREVIADVAIWTGKKHYIMRVWDSEGTRYAEPDLKVVGIEMVKSSTPFVCREKLKEATEIFISGNNEELMDFIEKFRSEFSSLPLEDIGKPTGMNDIDSKEDGEGGWELGTPYHVKGSIVYNNLIVKNGMEDRLRPIQNGDKVKCLYLTKHNPFGSNVISFLDTIPKEWGVEKYIDYQTQFEKTFVSVLDGICKVIGWRTKYVASLDEFL